MSEINLFSLTSGVIKLESKNVTFERELQVLIEKYMPVFFGVTFLKSEFPIANGRMDSLGIDENNCPVIFEYKRSMNENVINQGLFYLECVSKFIFACIMQAICECRQDEQNPNTCLHVYRSGWRRGETPSA